MRIERAILTLHRSACFFFFFFGLDGSELTRTEMSPAFLTYGRVRKGDASLNDARSFTGQDA